MSFGQDNSDNSLPFAGVTADGQNVKDPNLAIASMRGRIGMRHKENNDRQFNHAYLQACMNAAKLNEDQETMLAPELDNLRVVVTDPDLKCESHVWGQVLMVNLFNADWYKEPSAAENDNDTLEHEAA